MSFILQILEDETRTLPQLGTRPSRDSAGAAGRLRGEFRFDRDRLCFNEIALLFWFCRKKRRTLDRHRTPGVECHGRQHGGIRAGKSLALQQASDMSRIPAAARVRLVANTSYAVAGIRSGRPIANSIAGPDLWFAE